MVERFFPLEPSSHLSSRDRGRRQLGRSSQVGLAARQSDIRFGAERLGPREQGAEALGAPVRRGSHSACVESEKRWREGEREGEGEKGERSRGNIKCFHFSSFFFF